MLLLTGDNENEVVGDAVNFARSTSSFLARENDYGENLSSTIQATGLLSATLAELRQKTDRVMIFGDDLEASLPRFWEFIGSKKKENAIWLNPKNALETIRHFRLKIRGVDSGPNPEFNDYETRIKGTNSGVVFFNSEILFDDVNEFTEILLWLKELGAAKKWFGQILFPGANENGISQALLSALGSSGGWKFEQAHPIHDARNFQWKKIVANHETDAVVIVGDLPKQVLEELEGSKLSSFPQKSLIFAWMSGCLVRK